MASDYYQILGISKNAGAEEIKRAYRSLALKWHPDRNKSPEAEAKFKEINEAYAILSDPQKRSTYDQVGHEAFKGGGFGGANHNGGGFSGNGPFNYYYSTGGSGGGFPFGGNEYIDPFEIFEQFFGGGFRGSARGKPRDVYQITVDFFEAIKGATKEIYLPRGQAGEGSVKRTIKIPAGIDQGNRIRFDDFDIVIDVKPDARFKRDGQDIFTDIEVQYPQAALGTTISVDTVDGPVRLKVNPGTQPGTLIRLKGKGIRSLRGNIRGDHYVKLLVPVPQKLSREQKRILEELSHTF